MHFSPFIFHVIHAVFLTENTFFPVNFPHMENKMYPELKAGFKTTNEYIFARSKFSYLLRIHFLLQEKKMDFTVHSYRKYACNLDQVDSQNNYTMSV